MAYYLAERNLPPIPFEKWQACGNDFIVTEAELPNKSQIMTLCDRHFGIGADGLICVHPSEVADARMRIINQDGTEAEMCGNGIRCVGQYLAAKYGREHFTVETQVGVKDLKVDGIDVHVNMGKARLLRDFAELTVRDGRQFNASVVDIGNPHCVLFLPDCPDEMVDYYGPMIENMTVTFPERTNVEFVTLAGKNKLRVKVWERGCGRTLACGTGACASAYAVHARDAMGDIIQISLEGGEMEIRFDEEDNIIMVGPAELVFRGKMVKPQ